MPPNQPSVGSHTSTRRHTVSQQTEEGHVPTPAHASEKDARCNGLFACESEDTIDAVMEFRLILFISVIGLDCSESREEFLRDLGHLTYHLLGLVG